MELASDQTPLCLLKKRFRLMEQNLITREGRSETRAAFSLLTDGAADFGRAYQRNTLETRMAFDTWCNRHGLPVKGLFLFASFF